MKHFLLTAAMLLSFVLCTKAQTIAKNTTDCDVTVRVNCYDAACSLRSTNLITVVRGATVAIPTCRPNYAVYEVCWVPAATCFPSTQCTKVDGIPSAPAPCGIGTTSSTIQTCDYCNNGGGGIGYVDFIPGSPNLLDIHK